MAKPINLNQARKDRRRMEKRKAAEANAAKFGRSKAERARDDAEAARAALRLDSHKLDKE